MDDPRTYALNIIPAELAICRLAPDAPLPDWADRGGFVSLTRTQAELSIVCEHVRVPAGVQVQAGWVALEVEGPLNFGLVGVLASLTKPLADAGVGLFAISTFDTDYILIQKDDLSAASAALRTAGHQVKDPE